MTISVVNQISTKLRCVVVLLVLFLLSPQTVRSSEAISPHAVAHPVGYSDVRWMHGFWADRFELVRTSTVPALCAIMEGTNYSQFLRNFEIAAGVKKGEHHGATFNDGEFYKLLEGECVFYSITHDPNLAKKIEYAASVIEKAQRADGYLFTRTLIKAAAGDTNARPFRDPVEFETYDMGHLLTTACAHFQATGQTNLLEVARKCAKFLDTSFSKDDPEMARFTICPSHYMGLVDLYRTTGDTHYLKLVEHLFELRKKVVAGTDDNQDRIPFEKQTNIVGHAVRANYLYSGAADVFAETGNPVYLATLETLWTNLVEEKMYLTGGCGALYDGASPDASKEQRFISRVHQAYGRNYQLPNLTAHNETCANIGNYMWNSRMFLVTGDARYWDVAELALYNSILSGVSLDGTNFLYVNPLRHLHELPQEMRWSHKRLPFINSFCCPPNLVRTIAELGGSAYSVSNDAVWVNLYGANHLNTTLPGGRHLQLTQETDYPWNGRIKLRFDEVDASKLAVRLRIPGWSEKATVRVNGKQLVDANKIHSGSYCEISRQWSKGDLISVDLEMSAVLVEPNPLIEEDLNQLAVRRGPVVYCLESGDLPKGIKFSEVMIPQDAVLTARYDKSLLGGVAVVDTKGIERSTEKWDSTKLYRELKPTTSKPFNLHLIPYSVWGNRGDSEMSVWLPRAD